jgi:hypothetical protein
MRPALSMDMMTMLSSLKMKSLPLLVKNNHTISNASVRNGTDGFGTLSQHFQQFTTAPCPSAHDRDYNRIHDRGRETKRIRKKEQARHKLTPARGCQTLNV